jgi:hypothetical protein
MNSNENPGHASEIRALLERFDGVSIQACGAIKKGARVDFIFGVNFLKKYSTLAPLILAPFIGPFHSHAFLLCTGVKSMISAKWLFSVGLSMLAISGVSFVLVMFGIQIFRLFIYIGVLGGVFVVGLGLIGVMTGKLKDDLRR